MNISRALKWSFLSGITSRGIQPLVFVILARLLTPEDYGVVAAATMVISFSQIFWEAGMGKAIIQYSGEHSTAASTAFWINSFLGVVVAGLLIKMSGTLADNIFHDHRVEPVLQAMTLQILLSAIVSVHIALFQKDMHFKKLFWVRLLTVGIPGLVSIPLAWKGMGYWALVVGTLTGQTLQVLLIWQMSKWHPTWQFNYSIAKKLLRFGSWVACTGLLGWFYLWADSFIVSMYLGSHELGLYRAGNQFALIIYGSILNPLLPVLYSYLSSIQSNKEKIKGILLRIIRILTFIAIPLGFLISSVAKPLSTVVLGSKWQGVELIISVICLAHGFAWVVGANGEAYRAIGRPDCEAKIMAISFFVYLPIYLMSIQNGLEMFLWARLCLDLASLMLHLWIAKILMKMEFLATISYLALITSICMPLVVFSKYLNHYYISHAYANLLLLFLFGLLWLCLSLWLLERKGLIPETLKSIKNMTI